MKKLLLIIVFLNFILVFSQSSGFNSDSYSVTRKDLETNTYKKDSTANALIIYETGNSYYDRHDYILKHNFKQKIKILNRKGFEKATITLYLYNNEKKKQEIDNIIATTYNLENNTVKKTKLNASKIYYEKYNANYTLIKFTFPNVKANSVLTYSYTLTSPFMYKYKSWEFQSDVPKLYSEYKTSIPGNFEYNTKLVGRNMLTKETSEIEGNCITRSDGSSANCLVSVYAMKDIPAFVNEEYMTTKDNYLSRIEYELKTFRNFSGDVNNITKTWKTADKEIKSHPNIGKQLNKSVSIESLLNTSIINETDQLKKAKLILKHIQANYTWNKTYDVFDNDVSLKNIIANKSGSVLEINILLHNLLKECNIDVKPILLSTRKNGFPTKLYPILSEFNYLILQATINNKKYLLDATDKYTAFGQLPFRCLNQYGRLLDFKNGSKWVNIETNKPTTSRYKVELSLNDKKQISGKVNHIATGYHAHYLKESYFENPTYYVDKLNEQYLNIEISEYLNKTKGINNFDFEETFTIECPVEEIGENIYLNPFLLKFFKNNPFKLQERTYPIDFGYKDIYLYTFKIKISDAYEIIETPKDASFKLPQNGGLLTLSSSTSENEVLIYFKLNFNKALYSPEYYAYLKSFMNHVISIQNNSNIVLKRK